MNNNDFNRFLKNLYDMLKEKEIVSKRVSSAKEKLEALNEYLIKLDNVQTKAYEQERINLIKELYYEKYIIKESDVPNSYWQHLEKKYISEGYPSINLVNPRYAKEKDIRKRNMEVIIKEQKNSLDVWLDYMINPETNHLPMWAKVWAFQGMLKIGPINSDKTKYLVRRNNTISPFIQLDIELLNKSYEYLKMHLGKKEFSDLEIRRLAQTESFAAIYSSMIISKRNIKKNGNEGIWIKYNRNNYEDALKLFNSLQEYNTGWFNSLVLDRNVAQICGNADYIGGDFYVYYSKDENNEFKIPRIGILFEEDKIIEVRGVDKNQGIELELVDILEEKLLSISNGFIFAKKIKHLKKLRQIILKENQEELSAEDLVFLYELNEKIDYFGFDKNPLIKEIIKRRNIITDLNKIFKESKDELKDLNLSFLSNIKDLIFPLKLAGDLVLSIKNCHKKVSLPEYIGGNLYLKDLEDGKNIVLPKFIGKNLYLDNIRIADNLDLPKRINGSLYLPNLTSANNLILPDYIGGSLYLDRLTDTIDLKLPKDIEGDIYLSSIKEAAGLKFPDNLKGGLHLGALIAAKGLILPVSLGGSLYLSHLTYVDYLNLPISVGGSVYLGSLVEAKGLILPRKINGSLHLRRLSKLEGILFPDYVEGNISLESLSVRDMININLNFKCDGLIFLKDGMYTLDELKSELGLNEVDVTYKRGMINIYLLVFILILLGIFIALIILKVW